MLRHPPDDIRHAMVHQAKVPGVLGEDIPGDFPEHPVINPGAEFLKPAFSRPAPSFAVHHLSARLPARGHLGDDLRRVLKVRVDDHHSLAPGIIKASGNRHLMPPVGSKMKHADARIPVRQLIKQHRGFIPAAIVYIDQLVAFPHPPHCVCQAAVGFTDGVFLIITGDDH